MSPDDNELFEASIIKDRGSFGPVSNVFIELRDVRK